MKKQTELFNQSSTMEDWLNTSACFFLGKAVVAVMKGVGSNPS
jgi:hypothetical protein